MSEVTYAELIQMTVFFFFQLCVMLLLNCGAGEDSWESFRQQGDPTSQS